jgi:four helix bundle protein
MFDSFEDLNVFQRAYKISLEIHKTSLSLPQNEQRALADQMRRASKSICANIAEGYGKRGQSVQDFKRFLAIAIGSADEMRLWSRYCLDLGYIEQTIWQRWRNEYHQIAKMLQGLIAKS